MKGIDDMEQSTIIFLRKCVREMISNNTENLSQGILNGTTRDMSDKKACAIMMVNCMSLSVEYAVVFILNFLEKQDVISLDEREIKKLLLSFPTSKKED